MARKLRGSAWWGLFLLPGWLLGWAGCLCAQTVPAQFAFQHIQEKDGLSFNFVNCFLQDRDGFLWVGTFRGLNRYDGNRFFVFKHDDHEPTSLLHNTVYGLCEDRQGNIWMAVENGICCYEKTTGRFKYVLSVEGKPLKPCKNILCDRNGDIWFTSDGLGLCLHRPTRGTTQRFPGFRRGVVADEINWVAKNGLALDPLTNRIWLSTEDGLACFDISHRQFANYRHNPDRVPILTNHFCSALTLDGDRLVFADNDDQRIVSYSLTRQQVVRAARLVSRQDNRTALNVATIFVDRKHDFWISSANYVTFHLATGTGQLTELIHEDTSPTSIASSLFQAGWQHPDGTVWLGTVNGISQTNPDRAFYSVYNLARLYPPLTDEGGITSVYEDDDGSWWLGTHVRGLLHYDPKTNHVRVFRLPDEPARFPYGGFVTAIVPYGNELFVGANIGFSRLDKQTGRVRKIPFPPGWSRATSLRCSIRYGDLIWVGNDNGDVFGYSPQTGQWRTYAVQSLSDKAQIQVRKLLVDGHGDLWAHILPDGFARFDKQRARFVVDKPVENTRYTLNAALAMTAGSFDRAGNIWMTSNGFGLWRYNPTRRTYDNWTETDGLAYDRALNAITDNQGHVWVGSYNQFSVFVPARNRFVRFKLPINDANIFYFNALHRLRNGHILAALKGYLVEFFPEKLTSQNTSPPDQVLISQVDIGDSSVLAHRGLSSLRLKAEENAFAIHFAALTSSVQTPMQFMYQLDGYEDWKRTNEASYAIYTKMPGGDYTFRVKGVTADGRQTPVRTLAVHIETHFYRTAWFWGGVVFILLGLVTGFLWYRSDQIQQVHALHMQASRLARDKTEIQYQNLINHLNPHFLFNSLTSLNSLITINPREASQFLRKLSIIYRYILQNKEKELVSLSDELSFVQHYIELQQARFREALQITVAIDPDYLTRQIVPVTIQNLLENAIKHNTLDKESPLTIRIYTRGQSLVVENNLQMKDFVETSNKQGLASLQSLYQYLSRRTIDVTRTDTHFAVSVPLL